MSPDFDRVRFTALMRTATEQAFRDLQRQIGNERLYTFGLYTNGEGTYALPTANTEEALVRKARAEAAIHGQMIELYQESLRWSPCDWEYHEVGGDTAFTAVDTFLETGWTDDYTSFHYDADTIYACCLDVLSQLRHDGLFTTQQAERPIVLNLFMGDQSDEKRLEWASLLNGPDCCAQLQHEFEQGYAAFRQLADAGRKGQ
jgi:hypothetical protein